MIRLDCRLFGTKEENSISIIRGTALGSPFKIGEQNCTTGAVIENKSDLMEAYESWMRYRIRTQIPPTIEALDAIAFRVLASIESGEDVVLACTCNDEPTCHGQIIIKLIQEVI